jgi:AcrR family transcriptional regulator
MTATAEHALSPRAQRTREKLVRAAAVVFPRMTFLSTRITDITSEAGTASGSFYNYFSSKEEILHAVISEVNERMFDRASPSVPSGASPMEKIRAETSAYVAAYRADAPMLAILEQVATFSPEFTEMRRETRQKFRSRIERRIVRWQTEGLVAPQLPARYAAGALASMVSNFCYMWLVVGEEYEEYEVVDTLSMMWAQSLGLRLEDPSAATTKSAHS